MPSQETSSLKHGKSNGLCDAGEHVKPCEIRWCADRANLADPCVGQGRLLRRKHTSPLPSSLPPKEAQDQGADEPAVVVVLRREGARAPTMPCAELLLQCSQVR
ncbi:unnamed protein product [Urochloa humidicola]